MPRKDETGPRSVAVFLSRPVLVAAAVALLTLLYIGVLRDEPPTATDMPEDVGARPTGAGTLPDGVADERVEGQDGGTDGGEIIDNSASSDARPEILDADDGPPPAETLEDVEPTGPAPLPDE